MAKHDKQTTSNVSSSGTQSSHLLPHVRYNPATSSNDYFFPLKLNDAAIEEAARLRGYQIGWTILFDEKFRAAMVPCKRKARDEHGNEIFLDTPEAEQHARYNAMINEAMTAQDRKRHDGRCWFFKDGLRHRCQYRKKNPSYDPNRPHDPKTNPKTVRVRCEECPYERFKNAHDEALFSELEQEDDCGEIIPFEGPAVYDTYSFESYDGLSTDVMTVLHELKPKLGDVVDLLAQGLTQAEAAEALGKAPTTINSQVKSLRRLLDTVPELQELLQNN